MNKIIAGMVGVAIAIIVLAGVLMPVLDTSTATTAVLKNSGVYYMTDDPTDYTLEYKGTAGEIYVKGEKIYNRSDLPLASLTLISTPQYLIRLQNYSSQNYSVWLIGLDGTHRTLASNTTESLMITVTDSTISMTGTTDVSYSGAFRGIVKTGGYVMTNGDPFVVNDTSSIIVGNGTTSVDVWYDAFYISGTVEDMHVDGPEGITITDVEVNSTQLTKYVDCSEVSSVTFTATGTGDPVSATYNRVIIPESITVELSQHLTPAQIGLLAAIPIMIIVAVLMLTVSIFIRNRY